MNLKDLERRIHNIEVEKGVKPKKYYIIHVRFWKEREDEDPNIYMLMIDDDSLENKFVQNISPDDAKAFWEGRMSGEEISKKPGWNLRLKAYEKTLLHIL